MPFVKFVPSNDSLCRRKSSGTMCLSSVMILTSSAFLSTTSFLLVSLRDTERDLVTRLSNTISMSEGLDRLDPRATGCELLSLLTPAFFNVVFLSPASVLVAARAAGLDVSASSFGLALKLLPRLGLVAAAVLVNTVGFLFFTLVSFGAALLASDSPVTLATSPCVSKRSRYCGQRNQ